MRIGVTSQNFKTITGHAGKARRFLIFESDMHQNLVEIGRWDLPKEMSIHEYSGSNPHPLAELDILVTGGCGQGFQNKLARLEVKVIVTGEPDPFTAAQKIVRGKCLQPPVETNHSASIPEVTIS